MPGTGELAGIWAMGKTLGQECYEGHLAEAGVRMEPQDSTFAAANSARQEARRLGSWERGEAVVALAAGVGGGRGGATALGGLTG